MIFVFSPQYIRDEGRAKTFVIYLSAKHIVTTFFITAIKKQRIKQQRLQVNV